MVIVSLNSLFSDADSILWQDLSNGLIHHQCNNGVMVVVVKYPTDTQQTSLNCRVHPLRGCYHGLSLCHRQGPVAMTVLKLLIVSDDFIFLLLRRNL